MTAEYMIQCPHCQGNIRLTIDAHTPETLAVEQGEDEEDWGDQPFGAAGDAYFKTLERMEQAIGRRQYSAAVDLIIQNLECIPDFAKEEDASGEGIPPSIPALEQGGRILALVGNSEGLQQMRQIVSGTKQLSGYSADVDRHFEDMMMFQAIRRAVNDNPNCLQSEVKFLIGAVDGRRVANLVSYLEKSGEIQRFRDGRGIRLSLR